MTSSTTTSSTTSSTTTTVPPGLEPQVLSFALEPGMLLKYEAVQTIATVTELVDTPSGVFGEIRDGAEVGQELSGELWQLTLPGPDGHPVDLTWDFRPEEGSLEAEVEDLSYAEVIEVDLLDYFGGVVATGIATERGEMTSEGSGAPWFWRILGDPLGRVAVVGPPLPVHPVDVGERWFSMVSDPLLGMVEYESWVSEEIRAEHGLAFAVEYRGLVEGTPITLSRAAAAELLLATDGRITSEMLALMADADTEDIAVAMTAGSLSGSYLFDPIESRMINLESSFEAEVSLEISIREHVLSLNVMSEMALSAELATATSAEGFERNSVLDRVAPDAWRLAEKGLIPLAAYDVVEVDEEDYEREFEAMRSTPAVVAAIVYAAFGDGEQTALVFSMVSSGRFRAAPILSEGLSNYWARTNYGNVRQRLLGGNQTHHSYTPQGWTDWTVWVNESHVFVVIGDNPLRDDLLLTLMQGTPEAYWWQAGDCLDFADDFGSELPWAPVGALGLRHCASPHSWEVLDGWQLDFDEHAAYPQDIDVQVAQHCGEEYFVRFDSAPLSQGLRLESFAPNRQEWEMGRRYGACALAEYDASGIVVQEWRFSQESVLGSYELDIGDCLAGGAYGVVPVSCSVAHRGEIVGVVAHETHDGGPPDASAIEVQMQRRCEREMWDRGKPDYRGRVVPMTDMFIGWDHGVREYYCVAWVRDDYNEPTDIKGEFFGDWEFAEEQVGT